MNTSMATASTAAAPAGGNQSKGYQLITVQSIFFGLATLLVAARLYTRQRIVRKLAIDDLLMVISWVSCKLWVNMVFHANP